MTLSVRYRLTMADRVPNSVSGALHMQAPEGRGADHLVTPRTVLQLKPAAAQRFGAALLLEEGQT